MYSECIFIILVTLFLSLLYNIYLILHLQTIFTKNFVNNYHFLFFDFEICLVIVSFLALQAYFMALYNIIETLYVFNIFASFIETSNRFIYSDYNLIIIVLILLVHACLKLCIQIIPVFVDV